MPKDKGYISSNGTTLPLAFLGSHKMWRLGNLIRQRYGYDRDDERYWKRMKIAHIVMAMTGGPISYLYGDEVGDMADCWHSAAYQTCRDSTASDNVARIDGRTSNFTIEEKRSSEIVEKLLEYRSSRPELPGLSASVYVHDEIVVVHKSRMSGIFTGNTVAVINLGSVAKSFDQYLSVSKNEPLTEIFTGEKVTQKYGTFTFTIKPLEAKIYTMGYV